MVKKSADTDIFPIIMGAGITGIVLSGVLATMIPYENFIEWVRDFQTLIAGGLALLGALLTVALIRRQIALTEQNHDDLIERNLIAARSVLPLTLSELVNYAQNCLTISFEMALRRELTENFSSPPEGIFEVFREVIKYAPNDRRSQMAELLSHLQVQISHIAHELERYDPLTQAERLYPINIKLGDQNIPKHEFIFDAAKLLFQIENLLGFASDAEDEPENRTGSERFSELFVRLPYTRENWPNLLESAERRFD